MSCATFWEWSGFLAHRGVVFFCSEEEEWRFGQSRCGCCLCVTDQHWPCVRDMAATPPSSSNNLLKTVAKSKLKKRREEEVEVEQMWQSV